MGIASGIFWILFGIGYVIYQSFKEHPKETANGAIIFVILAVAISSWVLIFNAFLDYDPTAAGIFAMISLMVLTACICVTVQNKRTECVEAKKKYQVALEIAKKEPIDEEQLKKFEQTFWARPCFSGAYQSDKSMYRLSKDKSAFKELITKDYIENFRVYQVMATLDNRVGTNH